MPFRNSVRPTTTGSVRIWHLVCDGIAAGSYTDHCNRAFMAGDMLRDDCNNRCTVISVPGPDTLHVSSPDVAPSHPTA